MRILITRPAEDAAPLQQKLKERGHHSIIAPLLKIVASDEVQDVAGEFQAICVTSANALRVTPAKPHWLTTPLLTVGPQSLAEAQSLGYTRASAHGGDVKGLAAYINSNLKPEAGPILYLAGDQVSADLQGLLKDAGFTVTKLVTYQAKPQTPENFEGLLQSADAVMLYSPRTAKIYAGLIVDMALEKQAQRLTYLCLSANVAAQLPHQWEIKIAAAPNEAAMLALLDTSP